MRGESQVHEDWFAHFCDRLQPAWSISFSKGRRATHQRKLGLRTVLHNKDTEREMYMNPTDNQSTNAQSQENQSTDGQATDGTTTDTGDGQTSSGTSGTSGLDPDRSGTFIITDIYPLDLGENPPFEVLPGMIVEEKEVVGCVVKASQGTKWAAQYEEWFKRSWQRILEVASDRYGVDFFRGCYHFLTLSLDGAAQADYFCDLVDAAGGWGAGDLMPWLDIEEGGQGSWAPQKLETITDPDLRAQLSDQITTCATAFIQRFKERTGGLRIAVYGRGVFRDLQMTNCTFGSDGSVNPAYTPKMPSMDAYGIPLDDIILWQLQGTGDENKAVLSGYPSVLPGWGAEDYSVYIDGPRVTTLKSLRDRCLAHQS